MPNAPTSYASAGEGTLVNGNLAYVEDGSNADIQVNPLGVMQVDYLGFGFTVPAEHLVLGLQLRIKRYRDNAELSGANYRLLQEGTSGGTVKLDTPPTLTPAVALFGGASDLWGRTWTPAQVNAADLGVRIGAQNDGVTLVRHLYVDVVQLTVWSLAPGGGDVHRTTRTLRPQAGVAGGVPGGVRGGV